ncbi:MAG: SIMPL domain-containing protein [Candidatus Promineofilum sp.]|nr:SIMPL domain-containing protein [Promineifilum sp.]
MSTKKNIIAVLFVVVMSLALAACSGALPAQTAAPGQQAAVVGNAGGVTVVGQGTSYGQPDQATVIVGVDTFAPTVEEATTQNQTTLDNVMAALEAAGIATEDIQTTNYSLYAEQIYGDNGPEGIAGYRVSNQVNVKIRDISAVGDVLAAVTGAGANAIYGVNFTVADPAALEAEARAAAMDDARKRAESLAELGGVSLGDIVVISEIVGQPVMPLGMGGGGFAMEQAASAPGISPGQLSYQVQVQVTYGIGG